MAETPQEPYVTHAEHQEIIDEYRALARRNRKSILDFTRITTWILAALIVVQLALGVLSIVLLKRTGDLQQQNKTAIAQIKEESRMRQDQSCLRSEKDYRQRVDNLKLTYHFLEGLSPSQIKEPLNSLILSQLTKTEGDVKAAVAPKFCDKPGVGLPETPEDNPAIPPRPASLRG
jgi:hypothetical protein